MQLHTIMRTLRGSLSRRLLQRRKRKARRHGSTCKLSATFESLEDRRLLTVDVPFGVFTAEEIAAFEAVLPDPSLSTPTPPAAESDPNLPVPVEDGGHAGDVLTFVLDFKEPGQGMTSDVFGNVITSFDVTSYGFSEGQFNTVVNSILAETNQDFFAELVGTVAGPSGQDLAIDFIVGDIGTAPVGVGEYYYIQIGTGVSGPHTSGTLGVAFGSSVRTSSGSGPNPIISNGAVVGSVFTDAIVTIGGLTPSNALTSGNLGFTTFGIAGTLSHEIAHTLSLSHINKANSVQPTGVSPIMGTGAVDLPNQDRIEEREFSLSGFDDQSGGAPRQHIQQLVNAVGLHTFATDGNDQISEAFSLPVGSSTSGFSINSGTDVDMFEFTVGSGQQVAFDIDRGAASTLDSYIRLFNAAGTQLDFNDDGANAGPPPEENVLDSYLEFTFSTAGTYYLGVSAFGNSGYDPVTGTGDISASSSGTFTLTLTELNVDPNDQISEASSVSVGGSATGFSIAPAGDVDMFEFTVTSGQQVGFDIDRGAASTLNSYIRLFDAAGNQLDFNNDGGNAGPAPEQSTLDSYLEHTFATAGTYYLGVSASGNSTYNPLTGTGDVASGSTGTFTLTLTDLNPDSNDQISEAFSLSVGGSTSGFSIGTSDVDMFAFTVASGQQVAFDIDRGAASTLNSYIRLFNGAGTELASNDDGNNNGLPPEQSTLDSYLEYTFPSAGTFYLGVSAAGNSTYSPISGMGDVSGLSTGDFTLSLTDLNPDPNDQISEAFPLIVGGSAASASISPADDVDMFAFTVTSGQQVAFDIDRGGASTLDSYIRLFNGAGTQLASNDTGNNNGPAPEPSPLDPFLQYTFSSAGTYYLGVSSAGNSTYSPVTGMGDVAGGSTGDFTLSLTNVTSRDYGDAPDSYLTLDASGGPHHMIAANLFLGTAAPDLDSDGFGDGTEDNPNSAKDDDAEGATPDDEDGVTNFPDLAPTDTSYQVTVALANTTGGNANLVGWIDFDNSCSFELDEAATAVVANNDTSALLTWNNLGGSGPDLVAGATFARFRLTTDTITGNNPGGMATDGEVEDYSVGIGTVFTVDATGDGSDANLADDICDDGTGSCTLRAAIQQANATAGGADKIYFAIPGAGTHTIAPASSLPTITAGVTIDATTQTGYAGTPRIELNGAGAGAASGLTITSGGSSVLGLAINRFAGNGILLAAGGGNTIQENMIGTNPAGTTDLGNGSHGVIVFNSSHNVIGGPTQSVGNVISGNTGHGVFITRSGSANNDVTSNIIGLGANGSTQLGNDGAGVRIDQNATNNNIGGSGNVISSNGSSGVIIVGSGTTNNTLADNKIGTDITGLLDRGNSASGVSVDGAPGNRIGVPGDGNLISGNTADGIFITDSGASSNLVQGNRIGLTSAGNSSLPNGQNGVNVFGAPNNTLGGVGAGNVVSGNVRSGIFISGVNASGNKIEGNFVGLNSAGTSAIGNGQYGVVLRDAPNNTVGGTAGAGNVISGNLIHGIGILDPNASGNVVIGNRIGTDRTGMVDVGNARAGVSIWKAPGNRVGGLTAGERNIISGNDLFGVRIAAALASGNVVQGNYIGTNISGTSALPNSNTGVHLANAQNSTIGGSTAGARNVISGNGNHGVVLTGAGVLGNDVDGNYIGTDVTGTVALGNANVGVRIGAGAHDNMIGENGQNVISANGSDGVLLADAGTRNNTVSNNLIGTDRTGTVDLGNASSGVSIVGADTNTIGGTANLISGNDLFGVVISGGTATGNKVQGNAIGTDITGTLDLGNASTGVFVSAPGNTIGGTALGEGNLISGNDFVGVRINGALATGNKVQGNAIGTQNDQVSPLGNTGQGVRIDNAMNNEIGGTASGAGNVIAYQTGQGVAIVGTSTGNAIQRNSMFANSGLGIDLNLDGVTANDATIGSEDADSGPNQLQNFPVLSSAVLSGNLVINYSVPSTITNSAYALTIEFFLADASNTEGLLFLGSDVYTSGEATTLAQAIIPAAGAGVGQRIVATATDGNGNTSEFSANTIIVPTLDVAQQEGDPAALSQAGKPRLAMIDLVSDEQRLSRASRNSDTLARRIEPDASAASLLPAPVGPRRPSVAASSHVDRAITEDYIDLIPVDSKLEDVLDQMFGV